MSGGRFHRLRPEISANLANGAIADALIAIKGDDLTDADIGRQLCKSADRAAEYRKANAGMSAATFLRAVSEWGKAFGDLPLSLAGFVLTPIDAPAVTDDAEKVGRAAGAVAAMAKMGAGQWSDATLAANAGMIEDLGAMADELRLRLAGAR
jgi:hypothetical protein